MDKIKLVQDGCSERAFLNQEMKLCSITDGKLITQLIGRQMIDKEDDS
jgi:hypothetical protein